MNVFFISRIPQTVGFLVFTIQSRLKLKGSRRVQHSPIPIKLVTQNPFHASKHNSINCINHARWSLEKRGKSCLGKMAPALPEAEPSELDGARHRQLAKKSRHPPEHPRLSRLDHPPQLSSFMRLVTLSSHNGGVARGAVGGVGLSPPESA